MIKFIYEEPKSHIPVFGDVENDQFFVYSWSLYQKISDDAAQRICNENGFPCASGDMMFKESDVIDRILPKVSKIEF